MLSWLILVAQELLRPLVVRTMAKDSTRTSRILESVGMELKNRPPRILEKTRRKKGVRAAERQRVAILLNKARSRGARVPK